MKKPSLLLFGIAVFVLAACSDKVSDPEALYQKYLNDNPARLAKVSECKLLRVEDQLKSQSCTIAIKADGDAQMKKTGFTDLKPVKIDLGLKKNQNKKE